MFNPIRSEPNSTTCRVRLGPKESGWRYEPVLNDFTERQNLEPVLNGPPRPFSTGPKCDRYEHEGMNGHFSGSGVNGVEKGGDRRKKEKKKKK